MVGPKIFLCKTITQAQKLQIHNLWNTEYPKNLKHESLEEFENYLWNLKTKYHVLLLDDNVKVLGWLFVFVREKEVWFAMILDSKIQGKGFGTKLLNFAKKKEPILNGWAVDHNNYQLSSGKPYQSPVGFYLKNGFLTEAKTRIETPKLSAIKIRYESQSNFNNN